ncbi:hypothetical protein [Psychromonas aquimarina]|uniref:hypothetical protein n=1 Tax=Psychromonas aquimarina TaxID=444919 RepID=UPI00048DE462|nr:hypothetical protein [Psychromonas aquimarina]
MSKKVVLTGSCVAKFKTTIEFESEAEASEFIEKCKKDEETALCYVSEYCIEEVVCVEGTCVVLQSPGGEDNNKHKYSDITFLNN